MPPSPERQPRLNYPDYEPGFNLPDLVTLIVKRCVSANLLTEAGTIPQGIELTLGIHTVGDEKRVSSINYLKSIGTGTVIEQGAQIGRDVIIGAGCFIGAGVVIEHCSQVGDGVVLEEGSALRIGTQVGNNAYLGENAELNYDLRLEDGQKLLPGEIKF